LLSGPRRMCCLLYRSFDLRMHIGELVSSGSTSAAVCSIMLSSFTPVEATARLSFGDTHWIPRLRVAHVLRSHRSLSCGPPTELWAAAALDGRLLLYLTGRVCVALVRTRCALSAASSSAISSDRSSWLRLPPLMRARAALRRKESPTSLAKDGTPVCTYYFPLGQDV